MAQQSKKFELGENVFILYKPMPGSKKYEVKGTVVVAVLEELKYGLIARLNTIMVKYKVLAAHDFIKDDIMFKTYIEAKHICDKLNMVNNQL